MQTIIRQGDVLLISTDELPVDAVDITPQTGRVVLALGEVTGHAHAIDERGAQTQPTVRLWQAGVERFLQVLMPVSLLHEEHTALSLLPGIYSLPRQVEYVDEVDVPKTQGQGVPYIIRIVQD
jgi:hypothetical protein